MWFLIIGFAAIIGLQLVRDRLIYKHRGRAQPDDPKDENSPVITGPEDALAQRLADLYKKERRDK